MRIKQSAVFALFAALLFLPVRVAKAQARVGETVGIEGNAEFLRSGKTNPLRLRDDVLIRDGLRTQSQSKAEVLLERSGNKFVLGAQCQAEIISMVGDDQILLQIGTLRVVTSGSGTPVIVRTGPAEAESEARNTGFIASCGPPVSPSPDSCLIVGLYAQTQVTSDAFRSAPVVLDPQFFTVVKRGQRPEPPQRMPDRQFSALIYATTVVGSGSLVDRLALSEQAEKDLGELPELFPPPPNAPVIPPGHTKIPPDPEPPSDGLPPPPPPPEIRKVVKKGGGP